MPIRVLVIDDDLDFMRALRNGLTQEVYEVLCAPSGEEGVRLTRGEQPDIVLLDIKMDKVDGWQTCARLRTFSDVPILFLTALNAEEDVVRGLNAGADDYLAKPFALAELKARIEATVRRARRSSAANALVYDDGVLHIDLQRQRVSKRGQEVELTPKEFQILACLQRHPNEVLPHARLLREVWGEGYGESKYLSLYIRYLRLKLEDDPDHPHYIMTRYRIGYYFGGKNSIPAAPPLAGEPPLEEK
jgi:DNA-binding response OmpR family regulator